MPRPAYFPDNFVLALLATVALASLFPAAGDIARALDLTTQIAIAGLFFLHGAKLSRFAVLAGISHWRLHLVILASTFLLFPLLGWALRPLLEPLVTPQLYVGVLYLCVLPGTVQSAIAFTSMARGNIPAAVCAASASTLLGVLITPIWVNLLVTPSDHSGDALAAVGRILVQLLLPFVAGHLLQPWLGGWVKRHPAWVKSFDQGSILLVVYTAFSSAVIEGLWHTVPLSALVGLVFICAVILTLTLVITTVTARRLGFGTADEITLVFCGSKKSLASGVPMAKVLFAPQLVGGMVLPLMLFHQMQLMVCAVLAQRYGRRPETASARGPESTA